MTLTLYLALQCIQYTQFHSLPTPVVFLMNRSHDLVSFLAAGYVRSRYRINLSLSVSPFASWTLDELLLSLSIVPKNWSISTIRFFFLWIDLYGRYRPIFGYYGSNRPSISTVILRKWNRTDRQYQPRSPIGGTEPTVNVDRDKPTGRFKPTDPTDDTCEDLDRAQSHSCWPLTADMQ